MKYFFTLIALSALLFSKMPPLSFIALEEESWQIVVCNEISTCRTLQTEQEPRTYDYDFDTGNLVYIGADDSVRIIIDNREKIILKSKVDSYIQPKFIHNGKNILFVQLINKKSKKTKIVSTNLKGGEYKVIVSQDATILDPDTQNMKDIYYAKTSCILGCGKIIQELWYKDTNTGYAKQLTLHNSISYEPIVDITTKLVYYSSLDDRIFHIWQYDSKQSKSKQITFSSENDNYPSPYTGGLFFVRGIGNTTRIINFTFDNNGIIKELAIPKKYKKIRNLKAKQ